MHALNIQINHTSEAIRKFLFSGSNGDTNRDTITYRVPLLVAILSVLFQEADFYIPLLFKGEAVSNFTYLYGAFIILSSIFCLSKRLSRIGIILFTATASAWILPHWTDMANHTWLALWTIPMAMFFRDWWRSDLYSLYLRMTLGLVMLAAFAQKILAGTYIDGSAIYWLSVHGSKTEHLFSFACDMSTGIPCISHKLISQFILIWQLCVGILLFIGVRSILFLAIEIGFLLGAGVFADEMNFQVLNIAILCIIFQVGMPIWLLVTCVALLAIDLYSISSIVGWM